MEKGCLPLAHLAFSYNPAPRGQGWHDPQWQGPSHITMNSENALQNCLQSEAIKEKLQLVSS